MPYNPQFGRVSLSPAPRQVTNFCPAPHNAVPEAFEFGRNIRDKRRCDKVGYNGENHIAILGKPGSGKDTCLLIPNLQRLRDRSVVAVDVKGEMAAVCAPVRARYGRVVVLNPFRLLCDLAGYDYMQGCGFNPLCALDISSPEFSEDVGLLSEAHIPMASGEKQPFFPLTAREIVAFLIMVECVKAKEQGRDPYLFNVRRMLCEDIAEEIPPKIIGGEIIKEGSPARGIPAYAREMVNSPIMALRNKAGQFCTWSKGLSDAVATARTDTAFLDDARMAYFLSQNDFDFRELRERVTSVFLVVPMKQIKRHGKFLRMALTAALNACQRPRAAHEPRTVFVLNEYYSLGHLQIIEDNYTVVRGSGIQIVLSLHSIGQLRQLHDKNWETMLGSTDAICAFAPNDTETADWISKRSGEVGKIKVTVTQNYNRNSGDSTSQGTSPTGETGNRGTSGGSSNGWTANYSYEKLPALTTYDLYSMQKGEMRIIAANTGDTRHVHALPYYAMPKLIAETKPPLNPYAPGVDIPRIKRQEPDYEGFIRQRFGAVPLVQEINTSTWGYAPNSSEPPVPEPSNPAGNGCVDNSIWGQLSYDSSFDEPGNGGMSSPPPASFYRGQPGTSFSDRGYGGASNSQPVVGWRPDWVQSPPQAEPKPQAAAHVSPWLNPSAYVDQSLWGSAPAAGQNQPIPQPPAQESRPVTNYFVNFGSGTMNINFGNGAVQGNSASYNSSASNQTPSPNVDVPQKWVDADWVEVERRDVSTPALPAAPARPPTLSELYWATRQPQAPDSISGGVQAQHPGYQPDPAKTLPSHPAWRQLPAPDQTPSQKPKRGRRAPR